MRTLSEQDMLNIWEAGLHRHPLERATMMLMLTNPQASRDEVLALSVGRRDELLLAIRESLFGSSFTGFAQCQHCQQSLEFSFEADTLRASRSELYYASAGQTFSFCYEGYDIQACLPNSTHLFAIANSQNVSAAQALLLARCITVVTYQGTAIERGALPDNILNALGEAILARDPLAEVRLELVCSFCGHRWFTLFDILVFLWHEIGTHAMRTLRDVHQLASAYGWSESDILAMSPVRRRIYLEMVTA